MCYEEDENIDHEYTDEIVCPYCGYKFSDSWEFSKDDEEIGLIECYECEKSFYTYRHIEISYVTEEANYGTCKHCKSDNVVIEDYHSSMGKYNELCIKCGEIEKERLRKEYVDSIYNRK